MSNSVESLRFSNHLFWDFDIPKLDIEQDKNLIIERVLVYGNEADERLLYNTYSITEIKKAAKESAELNERTVSYLSVILNIPRERFKCYTKKPYYLV